jgi:hypothetical protein
MPRFLLHDADTGLWVDQQTIGPPDVGQRGEGPSWSVKKQTLRGGRRAEVDQITVDNSRLAFDVIPTRGLGLHAARLDATRVGWQSPITDGPVHPCFVDLSARGGLGWLQGFDELMARCGLESNGPPNFESQGRLVQGLHGRIANIPARQVAVRVAEEPPHAIVVEGEVDEAELFFGRLRLSTRISTVPGSNCLTVHDRVTNLRGVSGPFQLLYHWNFGPPQLEAGARFVAPVHTVCPRDARAAAGIDSYDHFGPPEPGFAEQVYYFRLHAGCDRRTVVLLRNRAGDQGVALRFDLRQLPCFTLWKCTQSAADGYVTGLEPGVNYPNARSAEEARGRVPILPPGGFAEFETLLEVLGSTEEVAAIEAEVARIQQQGGPAIMHGEPVEPFAPANT